MSKKNKRLRPFILKRSRLTVAQIDNILKCYAQRLPPKKAASTCKCSANTIYIQYNRIRWRLILTGYYENIAQSPDDPGLSPELLSSVKKRRGIREDNFLQNSTELIEWLEEWPPGIVLKHIRKIITLTGPLDMPPTLTDIEVEKLTAYIRYARIELIYNRRLSVEAPDISQLEKTERAKEALDHAWREYRRVCKKFERSESKRL